MRVGTDRFRCAYCLETKPLTTEHFSINARGNVNGYCRSCMRSYLAAYRAGMPTYLLDRRRAYQRDWVRRKRHEVAS